ncbi:Topoisomerase IV subunit A [Mycoplasmopsis meleagridis]|uniref:DNA topoisomerase (ATP-hydrolyzing) n=1 Tax=Mycoplasmopsis meleagridis ATCC 25294 TaxID=1264554 RepID=A0A0F5H1Q7_9BACT|nr:DNA topoisomerase IV subunit A [Mycoplasmopsis meleagridis]KKB26772.1 Topoisomerase IV subunit A [Mycoplasmopsis meleagridis ATCC 25294]KUH47531.1 DNA topoisomerase IV [Mycoplasmopsis meleagridis]OAD18112.1 Topoisomerase IV subunit A [Mycoplasmopsis meleagridis]VEU77306.1 DNA gyrase subunit A [Mycoplasmopsis meleagridis]
MDKSQKEKLDDLLSKIIQENLDNIMGDRFSRYSKYIIQQRALPDVRDGLKPVQRRILYSMNDLGLHNNKSFKKSARVVGDVIGKYHPHGDSSIYEAMVRMSQDWKMGYCLLEMHGNVGSIDDDPAAAMRYTEVRLAKISDLLLEDLKKNTVKFAPNFDDSEKEPTVLPSLIPNLLLNGAKGIASGFATEMPPHNLVEILDATIAKIKDPYINLNKLMKYIKGPDFPTGGNIYGIDGIRDAFETGKGKIILVSKYKTYSDNKNKYIEILEIPYGVVKSKLIKDIDLLIINETISGIVDIKDQSDRNGISILITLDKEANEEIILNYLLQKTEMKIYYNYNNVAIKNYSPCLLNLNELLDAYLNHVKEIKTKTLEFDLVKFKARLEIVLGFIKVSEITDQVIKTIRESENSKTGVIENLVKFFAFTQNQATAIAELRLYKLSKTDKNLFLLEKEELEKQIARCTLLLNNKEEFDNWLIEIFKNIQKEYGRERRTIIHEENIDVSYNESDLVKEEIVYVSVSKNGYLKRFSERVKETNAIDTFALKEGDFILYFNKLQTTDNLLIFTNLGNYAIIPVYKLSETKWKELGSHLSDFVELIPNEEIISVLKVKDFNEKYFVGLFTKYGQGKRVKLKDFEVSRNNKTFTAMKLATNDKLIGAKFSTGLQDVLLITKRGLASLYTENDVQIYGTKSNGTKSCYMPPIDEITAFAFVNNDDIVTLVANNEYIKNIKVSDINKSPKKNLGKKIFDQFKYKELIVNDCASTSSDSKLLLVTNDNNLSFEGINKYPLTSSNEGFTKIKNNKIKFASIYLDESEEKKQKLEKVNFAKENEQEKKVVKKAIKDIEDVLNLNIDDILKKLDIK